MFSSRSSLLRRAAAVAAALVLGLTAAQSGLAQPATTQPAGPIPTGGAQSYPEPGPLVPEILEGAGGGQTRTNTGQMTSQPVFTPGYFEVVCPAICYGGAFRVTNNRAFAGAGYYGPFRRYWAYGTYGPSFNIGPDNSLQYGLAGGCMYETQRACHGLYKHGGDCACKCAFCAKGGSAAAAYGPIAQIISSQGASPAAAPAQGGAAPQGPSRPPVEKLPQPTPNSAHLQLLVPENTEVLVEGSKTTTTGTIREFESPPLTPGKNMIYAITVRYTDAAGKPVEETHSVRVRANDQLRIDCTKPAETPRATVQRP